MKTTWIKLNESEKHDLDQNAFKFYLTISNLWLVIVDVFFSHISGVSMASEID